MLSDMAFLVASSVTLDVSDELSSESDIVWWLEVRVRRKNGFWRVMPSTRSISF